MSLEYVNTLNPNEKGTYAQTVIEGLAPGGGLYMPEEMPEAFDGSLLNRLPGMKMSEVSFELMRKFIPEDAVDDETLKRMMEEAHNFTIPVDHIDDYTSVAHLDEGPTAAFKDIAARVLAQLLSYENEKAGTRTNILVGTSGDTGVAIADAFVEKKNETVTVLYPTDGVSSIQEKHMLQVAEENQNIQTIPIKGTFNHAQNIVKLLLESSKLNPDLMEDVEYIREKVGRLLGEELSDDQIIQLIRDTGTDNLGSANSINFWRLAPQMTQYFVAYGEMVKQGRIKNGDKLTFSVPTGNVGHLMAGFLAWAMGLPVDKIIAGTNNNNAMAYLIGDEVIKTDGKHKTLAPSMDIEEPNNLQRLLWFIVQKVDPGAEVDYAGVQRAIRQFEPGNSGIPLSQFGVSEKVISYLRDFLFVEDIETDDAIVTEIKRVSDLTEGRIVPDSHGATGTNAAKVAREKGFISEDQPVVVLKTAHPDKFPVATSRAGVTAPKPHKTLEPLKEMDLAEMNKPEATGSILEVRRRVAALSSLNQVA